MFRTQELRVWDTHFAVVQIQCGGLPDNLGVIVLSICILYIYTYSMIRNPKDEFQ